MTNYYFCTENLTVGYNGKPLISEINLHLKKGGIMTLIGPNGSGKSTILKSISKHLEMIGGVVHISKDNLMKLSAIETATKISVVLTERIRPELMTCGEVVALGRYPYTNHFGKLTDEDMAIVNDSLAKVNGLDLADKPFDAVSDGQRQRIMLARAICQQPEIIVLDEPTSFLDIRYKIELLEILGRMAKEGVTIIMSLHEIDLAQKISDLVVCVNGDKIAHVGEPYEIFTKDIINNLYGISEGAYNLNFGSIELGKPVGVPKTFVLAGGGRGIAFFRALQRKNVPFYAGIIHDNDIDYQLSVSLAHEVFGCKAFVNADDAVIESALEALANCDYLVDSGMELRAHNGHNAKLLEAAKKRDMTILTTIQEIGEVFT